MFSSQRYLFKIRTPEDLIDYASLPDINPVSVNVLDNQEVLTQENNPYSLLIILDPKKPQSIQDHPVLGKYITAVHLEEILKEKPDGSFGVFKEEARIKVEGLKGVEYFYFVMGADNGESVEDTYTLSQIWADTMAKAEDLLEGIISQDESRLRMYLPEYVVKSEKNNFIIDRIGESIGNIAQNHNLFKGDLNKKERYEKLIKGEITPEEYQNTTPEKITDSIRKKIETKIFIDPVEEEQSLIESFTQSFQQGDIVSRMECFISLLAEAPHNILNTPTFVKIIQKAVDSIHEQCNFFDIEIYTPEGSSTGDITARPEQLHALKAVHSGSEGEAGPFFVRVKYRHNNVQSGDVHIAAAKAMVFDTGGEQAKLAGAKKMQGDMMAAACQLASMIQFAEDQPEVNVDFCFAVASNMVDGRAMKTGDIVEFPGGSTAEIANTDGEGRLMLKDIYEKNAEMLAIEGKKTKSISTGATLTGGAWRSGGRRKTLVSDNKSNLDAMAQYSHENGDEMLPSFVIQSDYDALNSAAMSADRSNVPNTPVRSPERAYAFIRGESGLEHVPHMHFDIATALFPESVDKQSDTKNRTFAVEGIVRTFHDYLCGKIEGSGHYAA